MVAVIGLMVILAIAGIGSDSSTGEQTAQQAPSITEEVETPASKDSTATDATTSEDMGNIAAAAKRDLDSLYKELLGFKDTQRFIDNAFSASGYADWLAQAQGLSTQASKLPSVSYFALRLAISELVLLGQEYRKTKGQENDETAEYRADIEAALK